MTEALFTSARHEGSFGWLGTLLHTTDSVYPIGGFAHSGGLEGMAALEVVQDEADLRRFLQREVAYILTYVELPLLYQAFLATTAENSGRLCELDQLSEAVRFAAEQRQASRRLGAQRWSLLEKLHLAKLSEPTRRWCHDLAGQLPHRHLCGVAGIEASLLGLPVTAAMIAFSHQTVMMVAQAALKILRIGQTSVQSLVAGMSIRYPELVEQAMALDLNEVGASLPQLDLACAFHETANSRLFLS